MATRSQDKAAARFPIVGIGASAGGLGALQEFLSTLPPDPGIAFVVVQHLAPDHKSLLAELLQRCTTLPVTEAVDAVKVCPNCIYVSPPGKDMRLRGGALRLEDQSSPRGLHLPIDHFFQSLAQEQHERAVAVVLSGSGSDGTVGAREVKAEGGMVMVQSLDSAEYDGMPRSVITAGHVDFQLAPAAMPPRLMGFLSLASGDGGGSLALPESGLDGALRRSLGIVRARTGHDLSQYKPGPLIRRIQRRMALHQMEAANEYVAYLQQTPDEVDALFGDMLIGVTKFFRDPEAFQALAKLIPRLFLDKPPGSTVRVWSSGCSTGEEAYSLAMLLSEHAATLGKPYKIQVFATDIDSRAIAIARAGRYPTSVAADVSAERLAAFFTPEQGGHGYQVQKRLRDLMVFSVHDIARDPAFSRLDLIVCRNLLIYLGAELQTKVLRLFHYGLNPDGLVFLGTSEAIGADNVHFSEIDRKAKLFSRTGDVPGTAKSGARHARPPTLLTPEAMDIAAAPPRPSPRMVLEAALLRDVAPPSLLVTRKGDVLYLHGRTGGFLEPSPGESGVNNLLRMARDGLRRPLTTALHRAADEARTVHCRGLEIRTRSDVIRLDLAVRPVTRAGEGTLDEPLYLVTLAEPPEPEPPPAGSGAATSPDVEARLAALTRELAANEEFVQGLTQELEASNAELRSSNEEMQAVNEELQSTNEELETSKEELQSVNEELATVNAELETRVLDLSRANNDMNNLLAGTGIGTVFLDLDLRVLRFTPAATQVIHLIEADIGRSIAHVVANVVGYTTLEADAKAVLDTLAPKDVDVQTPEGAWYTLRIRPYRTLANVIEGAVLTFVEITEVRRARDAVSKANELLRLAVVVRDAHDAITVQDLDGKILAWNPGAVRNYGWTEAEALSMNVRDRIPDRLRESALARLRRLSQADVLLPYRTQRIARDGSVLDVWLTSTALVDEVGKMYAVATTERISTPQSKPHRTVPNVR